MLEYYPFFLEINKAFNLRNNPNSTFSYNFVNSQQFISYAILVFIVIIMFSLLFMWYIYLRLYRHHVQEENEQEENNKSTDEVKQNIEMQYLNSNNITFLSLNSPIKIDNNNPLTEFDSEKTNDSSQESKIVSHSKMKDDNISPFSQTINNDDEKIGENVNKI